MNMIQAIIREEKLDAVKNALTAVGLVGLNVVHVTGRGAQRGIVHTVRGGDTIQIDMLPKLKIELVVKESDTEKAIQAIIGAARTGNIGDGKIFVLPVAQVVRVRTGERGDAAI